MQYDEVAQALHAAYQAGGMFPDSVYGHLDLTGAYRAQLALVDLWTAEGESPVGWKVGLTSKAMQAQQGVHEPCFGHLLASGRLASPGQAPFDGMVAPGFENELCLRLGAPLQGTVTVEQARAAIEAVAPALEIVEKRGVFGDDFPLAMAGNAQQRYFVAGAFQPLDDRTDLAATTVVVRTNGEERERATGAEVLDNPVNSVVWLAGALAAYDRTLKAGDLIMSGSFTKQYPLARGDRVRTTFDPFGAVEFHCP